LVLLGPLAGGRVGRVRREDGRCRRLEATKPTAADAVSDAAFDELDAEHQFAVVGSPER
jgi:hypothetical protein